MKKLLCCLVLVCTICALFVGCAEKSKCDSCGEEAYCVKETLFGEEVDVCRDCKKEIDELRKEFQEYE